MLRPNESKKTYATSTLIVSLITISKFQITFSSDKYHFVVSRKNVQTVTVRSNQSKFLHTILNVLVINIKSLRTRIAVTERVTVMYSLIGNLILFNYNETLNIHTAYS